MVIEVFQMVAHFATNPQRMTRCFFAITASDMSCACCMKACEKTLIVNVNFIQVLPWKHHLCFNLCHACPPPSKGGGGPMVIEVFLMVAHFATSAQRMTHCFFAINYPSQIITVNTIFPATFNPHASWKTRKMHSRQHALCFTKWKNLSQVHHAQQSQTNIQNFKIAVSQFSPWCTSWKNTEKNCPSFF